MQYPSALLDWAGHHSGGVRRLLDDNSGRPNKDVLMTNLLSRLESWAQQISEGTPETPRILLLVGGPGNGKTEAIEWTIKWLDSSLRCNGQLVEQLALSFLPESDSVIPRIVHVDTRGLGENSRHLEISIVQDASVVSGSEGSHASLLINELCNAVNSPSTQIYLCCVNRGILDDALIYAINSGLKTAQILLETITKAVSLTPNELSCWPLKGIPSIAIWPMDAESLLTQTDNNTQPPASLVFNQALDENLWPIIGTCPAENKCPFCKSRAILARENTKDSLLRILRWYELGSGKRWSFRDLFSLISYLLAGYRPSGQEQQADPCSWAAKQIELDQQANSSKKPNKQISKAIFSLVSSSYQLALFHRWDKDISVTLRKDIKELGLESDHTLMGLYYFLHERRAPYLPATIAALLDDVVNLLDPALASPDTEIPVSSQSSIMLRDLDARFSRSTDDGIEFIRKYKALSVLEIDLLKRIAAVDTSLSISSIRRSKPTATSRLQRTLRDFACRLVRRSLGAKSAIVYNADVLKAFQLVVEDDENDYQLYEVAQQVEDLLNNGDNFEISLTTTFGQPLPPRQRQATLVVPRREVKIRETLHAGRPHSPIRFLTVGSGNSAQPIALTYDLFKALKDLESGLAPASLPGTVVALLDTTRARLSGPIVRDEEILGRSKIRLGSNGVTIARHRGGFVSRSEGGR